MVQAEVTEIMRTSRDPVCGMNIEFTRPGLFSTYKGVVYPFCSPLCLERFNAIPALYTGSQRIADIRPIQKRRKLRLGSGNESDIRRAIQRVEEIKGVSKAVVEKDCLLVEYDLRKTILSQIEAVAAAEGLKFKAGLNGFRRRLWRYLEANELENAAHPGSGACCNRPPVRLR